MDCNLPSSGFVRLKRIIGDAKAQPPIPAVIPECKSSWWNGVKAGTRPQPLKLGPNTTVWRAEDIHKFIANGGKWSADDGVAIR